MDDGSEDAPSEPNKRTFILFMDRCPLFTEFLYSSGRKKGRTADH